MEKMIADALEEINEMAKLGMVSKAKAKKAVAASKLVEESEAESMGTSELADYIISMTQFV